MKKELESDTDFHDALYCNGLFNWKRSGIGRKVMMAVARYRRLIQ
jgi:hypothetical protein